ncbi:MAG: class I SAM-dependent methyltransferase [Plectolyngbya sp. WJT66-NPBG17]|jgi:2-polyprenyl-3-methyl-5-hydroxy-6-metoxy-1,4-benzoquinol methylase|nr:class I SAM-dependent methyltransferase [Plectolyngbya sp. WJT66-NPBG17]MBW4527252.1 class I SAM-dependent methyltransferase [Phormidium tanganyikae FI6-MK23]
MIQVLQNWTEIETATQALQQSSLPTHITIQKNWDQWLLAQLLQAPNVDRQSKILDLGCGDCCTLELLAALGFRALHGIDLTIKPTVDGAYQLYQGDLTATSFSDSSFDVAVSISVIEHGVNLNAFFREAYRLLKPGGLLFVTTDYWQTKISIDQSIQPFGLAWTVFSQVEIESAIEIAKTHGFLLNHNNEVPACTETTVSWYEKHYTFIALALRKPA